MLIILPNSCVILSHLAYLFVRLSFQLINVTVKVVTSAVQKFRTDLVVSPLGKII